MKVILRDNVERLAPCLRHILADNKKRMEENKDWTGFGTVFSYEDNFIVWYWRYKTGTLSIGGMYG